MSAASENSKLKNSFSEEVVLCNVHSLGVWSNGLIVLETFPQLDFNSGLLSLKLLGPYNDHKKPLHEASS
jgi:hypothetical protein